MSFVVKAVTKTNENPHEQAFRWFLEELKQYGYLKSFQREPESFIVLPKIEYKKEKHYKSNKPNGIEAISLFQKSIYTYDYRLIWDDSGLNLFTEIIEQDGVFVFGMPIFVSHRMEIDGVVEIVSYIDVKPHYAAAAFGGGKMASYYTFPFIQKYLYLTKSLYINKTIPIHTGKHGRTTCLFATTFVPNRYLYTDKSGKFRAIPYKKRSITSFVAQKSKHIDELLKVKNNKGQQTTLL